jgi:hypothetical protein
MPINLAVSRVKLGFKKLSVIFSYELIIIIATRAIIIPAAHFDVIFSLKNVAAIIADNTIAAPEVNGYKIADETYFAAIVLKYEYAKRHTAIIHITRNILSDFPSLGAFSVLFAIAKHTKRTIKPT